MKKIFVVLAALMLSTQAQAMRISSVGDSWTVDWQVLASATTGLSQDLSATSYWEVTSFTATQIALDISITNTSVLTGLLTNADITTFGFGITPDAKSSVQVANIFKNSGTGNGPNQNFPGGFTGIDVCIFAQGCSGGSVNKSLHAGDTDKIQLLLSGNFTGGMADLLYVPLKFQTNLGSFEPGGCINGNGCRNIPEPSILALLGAGLIVMGLMRRKTRS